MAEGQPKVYSVTQLTRSVRNNLLANNVKLAGVWIEGAVSGCRTYGSGTRYFALQDAQASINCMLFPYALAGCDAAFKTALAQGDAKVNGLVVQVEGELDLSMQRGSYSFKVRHLRLKPDEQGARRRQFEALKKTIIAEGLDKLDEPARRRPLPFLPRCIGIVTSASGAVIHDMCDVLWGRFPDYLPGRPCRTREEAAAGDRALIPDRVALHAGARVRLFPVKVQGDGAAEDIARGIRYFSDLATGARPADGGLVPDVLIVGRGGGSDDDLWAFNEEPAVRAVAACAIPVISAVGHERDVTLCDYVADSRAGTPSIGMAQAVPEKAELVKKVTAGEERLRLALRNCLDDRAQTLDHFAHRLATAPQKALADVAQRLTGLSARLAPALKDALARRETALLAQSARLAPAMRAAVQTADAALQRLDVKLGLLNPYQVLARGYSITLRADGRVVRAAGDVAAGDALVTRLGTGEVRSVVA